MLKESSKESEPILARLSVASNEDASQDEQFTLVHPQPHRHLAALPRPLPLLARPVASKTFLHNMGRVRTKTTKRASRVLIEKYYPRLTLDFHTNKRIIDEVAVVPSKRLRNKVSGFTTHLMKRIQRGPVRGISFKLQEEERERKDNYVPEVSALDTTASGGLVVDHDTKDLLKALNFESIPVTVENVVMAVPERGQRRDRRTVPGAGRP